MPPSRCCTTATAGALLAYCRRILASREDAEDALQLALLRAHRALRRGTAPAAVRPWLYAIARNRCLSLLAARREAVEPLHELEVSVDALDAELGRRAGLRELLAGLRRLPGEQRRALVLAEMGDLAHAEIAAVIGCDAAKVKSLTFQARAALAADAAARETPCDDVRAQLASGTPATLRRSGVRRHLRQCEGCHGFATTRARLRDGLAALSA